MEKPKDRDFIETLEGLLFCVVGYLHPPDGYTAYLKYTPDPDGRWSRGETRYARALGHYHVSEVEKTYNFLKEQYPQYLFKCPVRNITVSSVPCASVKTYYRPRRRLHSILSEGAKDPLEQRLIDLVTYLSEVSSLREGDFGVTGSMLTGSHNPEFSDIDLTVYGSKASKRLKEALIDEKKEGDVIQPYNSERSLEWGRNRSKRFPLSFEELMLIAERRWNYGVFQKCYFSIHPIRTDNEITERYGDRIYQRRGFTKGTAEITDNSESTYLPAIYHVNDVKMALSINGNVKQIVSYEGLFCDIFEEGEIIEFKGILEEVVADRDFYRIVIGGAGSTGGYIKLAS